MTAKGKANSSLSTCVFFFKCRQVSFMLKWIIAALPCYPLLKKQIPFISQNSYFWFEGTAAESSVN